MVSCDSPVKNKNKRIDAAGKREAEEREEQLCPGLEGSAACEPGLGWSVS